MTKKLSPEKRSNDILDAAILEFLERGYENASIERVATRAGLTKGGIYHHFSSKDEILLRANDRFMAPVKEMMERAMAAPSPAAGLRDYLNHYISYWARHERELAFVFLSLTKALQSSPVWPIYSGYRATMTGFLEGMAGRAVSRGELRIPDVAAWALALFAALDGVLAYVAMDKGLSAKQAAQQLTQAFIEGHGKASK
jgi:AcrR family transcriptional regulator